MTREEAIGLAVVQALNCWEIHSVNDCPEYEARGHFCNDCCTRIRAVRGEFHKVVYDTARASVCQRWGHLFQVATIVRSWQPGVGDTIRYDLTPFGNKLVGNEIRRIASARGQNPGSNTERG